MKIKLSKVFLKQYKKANVRIRHRFDQQALIFTKNHTDLGLRNHALRDKWEGHNSIDITGDWRAIFKEIVEGDSVVSYFVALGTHKDLLLLMKIAIFHELHAGGALRAVEAFTHHLQKNHIVDLYTTNDFFVPKKWQGKNWKTKLYKDTVELFKLSQLHKKLAKEIDKKDEKAWFKDIGFRIFLQLQRVTLYATF